jgi:uncharacterized protein (DUF302 family)
VDKQLPGHDIGIGRTVPDSFDEVVRRTETALKGQGFGVLTRIDVKATLKDRLDIDVAPHVILGACNPPLAHRALEIEPRVGLVLPCNVVVRQEGDTVRVEAMEPYAMVELFPNRDLSAVAGEASDRLRKAIEAI